MKKLLVFLFFSALSLTSFAQLSGDYYIPQGANPQGFETLASAIDSLNQVGLSGTVYFYIDDNLAEVGADLNITRSDLSTVNNLVIKPSVSKTPTISITGCTATAGGNQYAGLSFNGAGFVTIDGSNTVDGTTRDLTLSMDDGTNGRIIIQLYGNADTVVVKNCILKYGVIPASTTSSRGVYVNGQASGVTNGLTVENCKIGDGTYDPAYSVAVTGSSGSSLYASDVVVKDNELYGTLRRVYFYYVGTDGTTSEISGNAIYGVNAPPTANAVWGILFNNYKGKINIFNNVLNSLRSVTAGTEGMYAFGTLTGQANVELNIYNNFFGGDFDHSGTGTPASIDVVSFQDAPAGAIVRLYNNTIVFNSMLKTASSRMTCLRFVPAAGSTFDIKNNIFFDKKDDALSRAVYFAGSATTFTSDYNDIFVTGSAKVGFFNADQADLSAWQSVSGQDSSSVSKDVTFTSDTDFHLSGSSDGDFDLVGTPLAEVTTDIDGDTRSATYPYKGADEGTVELAPPLAGDYYVGNPGTGPGGSDPQFATLRDAFQVLNNSTFGGDCTFYITSDITETYASSIGLGLAINPEPYFVTFKPYTGVQPVITLNYPTDMNSGPSGALVIGIPMENNIAWNDLRTTKNIIIDGANTVDGSTRDLTIQTATTAHRNAMALVLVGDVSNVVVKNTNVYYKAQGTSTSGGLFLGSVLIRSRVNLTLNWIPKNLTFENNHLSSNFDGVYQNAQGIGTYQGSDGVLYADSITIKNNLIEGKRRAIALYRAANCDISGNEIILNQNIASGITNDAVYAVDVQAGSVVNIYNNIFSKISSLTNLAATGNTGISIETAGTYNIYNNMMYGFGLTATNPVAYVRGIKNSSATATLNLSYNSIYMPDLEDVGTGAVTYSGVYLSDGTNSLLNNIVVSDEKDFSSYCINRVGSAGTVTSDYNDFVPGSAGAVGYWNAAATATLSDWQTASSQDANSVSKAVNFVSADDLHLTGSSLGDVDLVANPISEITTDIDGDTRSTVQPYKGADEGSVAIPSLITIAQAIEDLDSDYVPDRLGETVTVQGVVFSPNYQTSNSSYYIYDGTAGTDIFMYAPPKYDWNMGDELKITGVVTQYNGMTEIIPADSTGWVLVSTGNATPDPIVLTLAQYKANPEAYEGTLVGFVSLSKVSGTWPASGSATLKVSDGVDTVDLRIDSDTDIDGSTEPSWPVDIVGIGSQYDASSPFDAGYQIFPRAYATDFLPAGTLPVELLSFTASVSNQKVTLSWSTATETNNKGFEIERKSLTTNWIKIGFIQGFGTTTEAQQYTYTDNSAAVGNYSYRLKQIDLNGTVEYSSVVEVEVLAPSVFALSQNYPNPFNPTTKISYSVPFDSKVTIAVYSITGELVRELVNEEVAAGAYTVDFNGGNLASGIYIYRMVAGNFVQTQKMVLMK